METLFCFCSQKCKFRCLEKHLQEVKTIFFNLWLKLGRKYWSAQDRRRWSNTRATPNEEKKIIFFFSPSLPPPLFHFSERGKENNKDEDGLLFAFHPNHRFPPQGRFQFDKKSWNFQWWRMGQYFLEFQEIQRGKPWEEYRNFGNMQFLVFLWRDHIPK